MWGCVALRGAGLSSGTGGMMRHILDGTQELADGRNGLTGEEDEGEDQQSTM